MKTFYVRALESSEYLIKGKIYECLDYVEYSNEYKVKDDYLNKYPGVHVRHQSFWYTGDCIVRLNPLETQLYLAKERIKNG